MAKNKSVFFCQECGFESAKWMGQCPACKAWNTFTEEPVVKKASGGSKPAGAAKPVLLSQVRPDAQQRMTTGIGELDLVLGGGIVPGSLVLVGGDPGIGKSTLLLQMCRQLSDMDVKTLYVSGEESLQQIRMRADRLGSFRTDLLMLCETDLGVIEETLITQRPRIAVIDSIQTMYSDAVASAPGSVSQVREATNTLMQLAKKEGIAIFIVGHVTKEGVVAGPRVLEHMVDTVLYFEGDRHAAYRMLRAVKNRFGSTNEVGVFEMSSEGLKEVKNPSQFMLEGRPDGNSGSVVSCVMEGTRPLMLEVQALVCQTSFQIPRRTAAGTDYNRVNLLLAVLEKRLGLKLGNADAYINLAGGMRLSDPGLDLAIVSAVISSYTNVPVGKDTLIFGEVGLTGEVRAVSQAENRVREAGRLGFKSCCIPYSNMKYIKNHEGLTVTGVRNVRELYDFLCRGGTDM